MLKVPDISIKSGVIIYTKTYKAIFILTLFGSFEGVLYLI
jgi:hypothetical protein